MIEKRADLNDAHKRFDVVARAAFPHLPLSQIFSAIRSGKLRLNGEKAKPQVRIAQGDLLSYAGIYKEEPVKVEFLPKPSFTIPILYEDKNFLILNKPKNIKTHDGHESLQAWVISYLGRGTSLSFSPGPCHRLDRQTSGVIVFAKTSHGARCFSQRQESDALVKTYIGILHGCMQKKTLWKHQLVYANHRSFQSPDGLQAITQITPLVQKNGRTLALFILKTGRTHQIRSQASIAGMPLLGDKKYGSSYANDGYFLHAVSLKDQPSAQCGAIFDHILAPLPQHWDIQLRFFGMDAQSIKEYLKS
ncbi:MAG: RluA family pseudouridine synthase [Spirochaetia bacterium]